MRTQGKSKQTVQRVGKVGDQIVTDFSFVSGWGWERVVTLNWKFLFEDIPFSASQS